MLKVGTVLTLTDRLWPEFVERDGAIVLAAQRVPPVAEWQSTLTAYERFHGHTHLEDHLGVRLPTVFDAELENERPDPNTAEFKTLWEVAQRQAAMWLAKLSADFPSYRFRVYASKLDSPILHFHRVRENEAAWISDRDSVTAVAADTLLVLDSARALDRLRA